MVDKDSNPVIELIYITNRPELAEYAQSCGIDRVMLDLEILGKVERQGENTLISRHDMSDIVGLRRVLTKASLQVRINPFYSDTAKEIDAAVKGGADSVMLPMFRTSQEASQFVQLIDGRCRSVLLLETRQAMIRLDEILEISGLDEVYIGLNDLHRELDLAFMFEPLSGGIVEYMLKKIKGAGKNCGFGGIAQIGEGELDARLILSEHVRLGSNAVILSRGFHNNGTTVAELESVSFRSAVQELRQLASSFTEDELRANHQSLVDIVGLLSHRENQSSS